MRGARFAVVVLGLALILAVATVFLPAETKSKPAGAAAPAFDHSNCQYPERWTNPANGCDNSDPAVPECLKAAYSQEAEAACIADFVKQHEQPQIIDTPVVDTKPNEPAAAPAVCAGK